MTSAQTNSGAGFPADLLLDLRAQRRGNLRERFEAALRSAIQSGRLARGSRLPPSRIVAGELGLSRSIVTEAYANLKADGYLETRVGAGTWIRGGDGRLRVATSPGRVRSRSTTPAFEPPRRPRPAEGTPEIRMFGGLPDPALFPRAEWLRHYRAALLEIAHAELTYPDVLGAPTLRTALAAYLGRVRGVSAGPERIVVCSGFTQGLVLVCRALRHAGGRGLAVEDPCFAHHRVAVAMAGLQPVPVPVDRRGLDPQALPEDVCGLLVAPAHSYPTGGTLDAERRGAVVEWARATSAVVIEDDYDAEFRYDRQPLGCLQGLGPEAVVYIGTASKSVSPALRLGWLAAPAELVERLEQEKLYDDMGSTLIDQLAFARFVETGGFARYLRRVRPVYRGRRDATIAALARYVPEARWQGEAAGLHLHVLLPPEIDELRLAAAAYERGVLVEDGAWHWASPQDAPPSIVLGYGAVTEQMITRGVRKLAEALRAIR
jgi:GntR family transcriptional regulator/MocR family aminotransferase